MIRLPRVWIALAVLCSSVRCLCEGKIDAEDLPEDQCVLVNSEDNSSSCKVSSKDKINTSDDADAHDRDATITLNTVPVIDVSALMDPDSHSVDQWDETANEVAKACEEWGFFQVRSHTLCTAAL